MQPRSLPKEMPGRRLRRLRRQRGAAVILAMMFLVIFGSLAAAMAIVAQGNLATADAHLKINRSQSGAETGMRWLIYRLKLVSASVTTRDGEVVGGGSGNATTLWSTVVNKLLDPNYEHSLVNETHNLSAPYASGTKLFVGPIAVAPGAPTFQATLTPHPLAGEDYGSSYYQRPPYSEMDPAVSATNKLDERWIRVAVTATDGPTNSQVKRTIQMDFKLEKTLRFALLSKSRVMIGRNVMVSGPIGSRFTETNLTNGHPIQMVSDFRGLTAALDAGLDVLVGTLATNDMDGDNRIQIGNPDEVSGISDPAQFDTNGDGYIDGYDFFLAEFDANDDNLVSKTEMESKGVTVIQAAQLMQLIDTFGDPSRPGFNDGFIGNTDRYAKIAGSLYVKADLQGWLDGASGGTYQDHLQGPVRPAYGDEALTFEASDVDIHSFEPSDFDTSALKTVAESNDDFATQAAAQAATHDPMDATSPQPLGTTEFEAVPFGAAHPYDFYDRPVYENMTFTNVKIPKGTNALFKNCTFRGVTFVETAVTNFVGHPLDPTVNAFNYAGMQEADGSPKHPEIDNAVGNTKTQGNNLRFDNCTFEGAVVSDSPQNFTHVRNKMMFTGKTEFKIDDSTYLSDAEKETYKRSTILAPHYSVELGTFVDPTSASESLKLTGTIVGGVIDMRGNIDIKGTLLTTFEPKSNTGPVVGDTSPQFNTTLGYFQSSSGDLEAELPADGFGVIHLRYSPEIPMPDGILGPISVTPLLSSYFEVASP